LDAEPVAEGLLEPVAIGLIVLVPEVPEVAEGFALEVGAFGNIS